MDLDRAEVIRRHRGTATKWMVERGSSRSGPSSPHRRESSSRCSAIDRAAPKRGRSAATVANGQRDLVSTWQGQPLLSPVLVALAQRTNKLVVQNGWNRDLAAKGSGFGIPTFSAAQARNACTSSESAPPEIVQTDTVPIDSLPMYYPLSHRFGEFGSTTEAGDGDRTRTKSLEGSCAAITPRPRAT
jgi:hypothetical protein